MAFQRPFLISLKRGDSNHKWGFSIKGGKDYCEPLVVQMVAEDSLAERFGLREGDEVIQVGRVNVQDLSLGQVHELLARCGNKIEMFVVREDLFSPRKGKEPPVVKAVVHNPYNSPLSLYSTENIAETLAKQTEVLTEGQISTEEDESPENLSFKQKSAVFQLLEEQSKQESAPYSRTVQSTVVKKPKSAPPPPPKPKPPSDQLVNGHEAPRQQVYQDQHRSSNRVEYQTATHKVVNQYQYQQEPTQYQQSTVYQTSYQSPLRDIQQPFSNYQQYPGSYQSQVTYQQSSRQQQHPGNYQSQVTYQQQQQGNRSPVINSHQQYTGNYQSQVSYQQQQHQSPVVTNQHPGFQSAVVGGQQQQQRSPVISSNQHPGFQSPVVGGQQHQGNQQTTSGSYQQLNQLNYRQGQQCSPCRDQDREPQSKQHQQKVQQSTPSVSKAEFKIGPPPPARSSSSKQQQQQDSSSMTAVYKQQYEQHLQKQYEQQQMYLNQLNDEESSAPKAHIIEGEIFEHNSTSGTPITYKTPPAAPPKPHWPPPERNNVQFRGPQPSSPSGMDVSSVWPPRKSTAVELPRTGFNPAAVREQGTGRRCVWPPRSDEEFRSGRNTPQSPVTGRRIQWNPSPSPPLTRRTVFSPSHSPARRRDIQWPPPSGMQQDKENFHRSSPRMSRKAQFDDYIHEHASINVPQTYRPPPGTQHVEFH